MTRPGDDPYDLVVVGAGTAGIPCALGAAEAGARVLLLEKSRRVGGTLHYSTGHLSAAGTAIQRERGIADTVEQHLADLARISHGLSRSDLVDQAANGAPATLDWLLSHGFDLDPATPLILHGHEPYSVPRTYFGRSGGLSVLKVLEDELRRWRDRGAIDLWLEAAVVGLAPEAGTLRVSVSGRDGDREISAGHVVLATGGFASEPELLREWDGVAHAVSAASPTSTGDGLLLGRQLGAAVAGAGRQLPGFGCLESPGSPGRIDRTVERVMLVTQDRAPAEILIDRDGRRFVAEDEPSIDCKERALRALPDWRFWAVFDEAALEGDGPRLIPGWSPEDFHHYALSRPDLVTADDLGQLAGLAGIDPDALVATVEAFNAFARGDAADPLGRKDAPRPIAEPPYYALRLNGQVSVSFAGLDVDTDLVVRRADGTRIEGLYAVGEAIGCAAMGGDAYCGGMMVTPSLTLGRALGGRIARGADLVSTSSAPSGLGGDHDSRENTL